MTDRAGRRLRDICGRAPARRSAGCVRDRAEPIRAASARGYLPCFAVKRAALAGAGRQVAQVFQIAVALIFEVGEFVFGVAVAIPVKVKLCVVALDGGHIFGKEPVNARAVTLAFALRKVGQHLGNGETVGSGFPARVLFREFAHQIPDDPRRRFEEIQARKAVVAHSSSYDENRPEIC